MFCFGEIITYSSPEASTQIFYCIMFFKAKKKEKRDGSFPLIPSMRLEPKSSLPGLLAEQILSLEHLLEIGYG